MRFFWEIPRKGDSSPDQDSELFFPVTAPISFGFGTLDLEDGPLRFELRRSSRRSIGISVELGGTVVVTAPLRASMAKIHHTLTKHGRWIRRKVAELRDAPIPPPPPKWVEGECHAYLGKAYPLRLIEHETRGVWLSDHELLVFLPNPQKREAVKRVMEGWISEEARSLFWHRLESLIRETPQLQLKVTPVINLRRMKARWGSCSPQGRILMNTHAVKLPLRLIDYILMHELCHLKVPNHSRAFWEHLSECLPDWRRRKEILERQFV